MNRLNRRALMAGVSAILFARPAYAALIPYELIPDDTSVEFSFNLSGLAQVGTMPIQSADIQIDLKNLANSQVSVTLNAAEARTKLPFARSAMLGQGVLDVEQFPTIQFVSTKVQLGESGRISRGAKITGDLTLRGITRPITLQADLFRPPGSEAADLDMLNIRLTGELNRDDFGASGFPDLVRETVGLNIEAAIKRAE